MRVGAIRFSPELAADPGSMKRYIDAELVYLAEQRKLAAAGGPAEEKGTAAELAEERGRETGERAAVMGTEAERERIRQELLTCQQKLPAYSHPVWWWRKGIVFLETNGSKRKYLPLLHGTCIRRCAEVTAAL